jgi:hypothetical protein
MPNDMTADLNDDMTLDPPGRIAVVGAGPLGLEAALYGRFLGYDVTVFERGQIGESLRDCQDQPLPMLPSECLSPLAASALRAQFGEESTASQPPLPLTIGQWLSDGLERLSKTDLLQGRVLTGARVTRITMVDPTSTDDPPAEEPPSLLQTAGGDAEPDDDFEVIGEVPPDFRLTWVGKPGNDSAEPGSDAESPAQSADFEAIIWATGVLSDSVPGLEEHLTAPYFFRIGDGADLPAVDTRSADRLRSGWNQIVRLYARLGGRESLDLYRPLRL